MATETKISTGSFDLNKFLEGGYESDIITTLYGLGGSGKSNFGIIVATSQARKGNKIIFMDTEGGFSSDRFKQVHQGTKDEIEIALQNILLLKPTSFEEQEKDFQKLLLHVKKGDVSLIIIDSIAMLYRLELGDAITSKDNEKIAEVNRKLAKQLRSLNEIARKQNISVIVTNQVYSTFTQNNEDQNFERKVSMVGGDLLKYWSKCLIELQDFRGKRKIVLRKHRSLPVKELMFEIVNEGIRKRGLF
ncbi:DNA repair and recombination protein RadB [Candidatus Pacearchaeota archaeon]|nr:DNA repair and recombination protein RadB [Candidatus Pacearchaeota archaeon]